MLLHCFVQLAEVSDRLVCDIAAGFWEEMGASGSSAMPSSSIVQKLHRKRATKHENRTQEIFKESGLSCPIPLAYVDIGGGRQHEVFRVESYLRLFSLHEKLPFLLGHVNNFDLVELFWLRYKAVNPKHCIYTTHAGREKFVIPCLFHADEGRTLKKSQIMVMNLQPVLGGNPDPEYDPSAMHNNFKYSTFATRMLLTVMVKKVYRKSSAPLDLVLDSIAQELLKLWTDGVEVQLGSCKVTLFIAVVSLKGDWPILAKAGQLARFFGRMTRNPENSSVGCCHLCLGGQTGYDLHDFGDGAAWRATYLLHNPFKSGRASAFSILPYHDPLWYRFDIFHTAHKGVLAELTGSALVLASFSCERTVA